jgi:hypothetical protein
MRSKFKDEHPFGMFFIGFNCNILNFHLIVFRFIEKRKAEAERIRQKYPDRIPVSIINLRKQKKRVRHAEFNISSYFLDYVQ